ncbi:hypothetical protein ISU10_16910 [Nocardioides agariphilus]|jgi:hypothetical protein|uniref:Uncharacterized protein n=1 Tax=Nocardioides agariphilus TaxID=433664 RepID=A0A930YI83_9ACTN|nr:hypothetical protein [Nocardioides agariphilus]MBF4769451.1 hypothetical protein [Nocardioides agariphilus]
MDLTLRRLTTAALTAVVGGLATLSMATPANAAFANLTSGTGSVAVTLSDDEASDWYTLGSVIGYSRRMEICDSISRQTNAERLSVGNHNELNQDECQAAVNKCLSVDNLNFVQVDIAADDKTVTCSHWSYMDAGDLYDLLTKMDEWTKQQGV